MTARHITGTTANQRTVGPEDRIPLACQPFLASTPTAWPPASGPSTPAHVASVVTTRA